MMAPSTLENSQFMAKEFSLLPISIAAMPSLSKRCMMKLTNQWSRCSKKCTNISQKKDPNQSSMLWTVIAVEPSKNRYIKSTGANIQLANPDDHRVNATKRAIQTWNDH
jgi:hypothetical protein